MTLKRRDPACRIEVLAPSWTFSLLARMPEVAESIEMPLGHGRFAWRERARLGRDLRGRRYDQAIVIPNSWKSALIPFFAGIPRRTGYLRELRWGLLNDVRRLDKRRLPLQVQRFVALGLDGKTRLPPECPAPALHIRETDRARVREKFGLNMSGRGVLGLCPGSEYGPAKRWPSEHFAALARKALQHGLEVWIFGSDKDRPAAAEIGRLAGCGCRDFSGRTTLAEAVDLLSLTEIVVSNDSGLMHVAAALDKRLWAIYGSSDPGFSPPLNRRARVLWQHLECAPCFARECRFGHYRCLKEISPERVAAEIGEWS